MIRVGFTGSQEGMTDQQRAAVDMLFAEFGHDAVEFHHGDCIGADADAHDLAENHMFDVVRHPPDNDSRRAFCTGGDQREPKPFLKRNRDIVDETDLLIACPKAPEVLRSGTWSTVRYARLLASTGSPRKIWIITPSGEIRREGR